MKSFFYVPLALVWIAYCGSVLLASSVIPHGERNKSHPHPKLHEARHFRLNASSFVSSTQKLLSAAKIDYKKQIHEDDPFVFCDDDFEALMSVSIQGNYSHHGFNADEFLSIMNNKRLAFVGDSLMRQLYLDFAGELTPYEHSHKYGYASNTKTGDTQQVSTEQVTTATLDTTDTENRYSLREYRHNDHNLTVLWCHDDNLQGLTINKANKATLSEMKTNPAHHSLPCLQEAVHVEYIVLGVGLWYKPLQPPTTLTDFHQDMKSKYNKMLMSLVRHRGLIHRANPRAHVIWQLIPHTGKVLEDRYVHQLNTTAIPQYNTGKYWSKIAQGATWPAFYNQAIHETARRFSATRR